MLGVVVLAALALGFVQTDPGRAVLVGLLERFAAGPNFSLSIGRLEGAVPFDMTARDVTMRDARGAWASLDRLHLAWRPMKLLGGVIDIEAIEAGRVRIDRRPDPGSPAATGAASSMSELPKLPAGIVIERLAVANLSIGAAVAGHAASLRVTANARLVDPREGATAALDVARIDGVHGRISAHGTFVPEAQRLDVDVTASEPEGGLVSSLLGVPSLTLDLRGEGPLERWRGDFRFDGGKAGARAHGSIALVTAGERRRLDARLEAEIAGLLPPSLAPVARGSSRLTLAVAAEADGSFAVQELTLDTAAGRLTGTGRFAGGSSTLAGAMHVALADPGTWSAPLTGGHQVAWRGASADLRFGGTVQRPAVDIEFAAANVAADGNTIEHPYLKTRIAAAGDLHDPAARFDMDGRADIARAAPAGGPSSGLSGPLSATLRGSIDRAGAAHVEILRIDSRPVSGAWRGEVSPRGAKGSLTLERVDLAAVAPLLHRAVAGRLQGHADIDVGLAPPHAAAALKASGTGLRTGDPALDRALGDSLTVNGGFERAADGSLAVRGLHLGTPTIAADVDGSIVPSRAAGRAKLVLADLGKLDERLGGRAEADVTVTGTDGALDARARIAVPRGRATGRPIENLLIELAGANLTAAPHGTLKLSGSVGGKPASGAATFALRPDGAADVRELDLHIGSVHLTGELAADAAHRPTGRLSLKATDLGDIAPLLLTDLSGSLDAEATVAHDGGSVSAHAAATPRAIALPGLHIGSGRLELDGRDLLGTPRLDGRLELAAANVGGVAITKLAVGAKGGAQAGNITVSGDVAGIALSGAADVAREGSGVRISLDTLKASRGGHAAALAQPASLVVRDGEAWIDGLALHLGSGSLKLAGRAGRMLDLRATMSGVPLSIAELAEPGLGIEGTLSGEAVLSGDARQPSGRYRLDVARLTAAKAREVALRPLQVEAAGTFAGGRVTTKTSVRGASGLQLTIAGSAPMAATGALDLDVKGRFDLTLMNDMLAATGQQVSGHGNVDLALGGPLSAPRVSGTLGIMDGRFEDPANGVRLSNLQVALHGAERRLTVTRLTGRTPGGGTLSGSGSVQLDPAAGMPADIAVKLAAAHLVSSDLASLVVGADLKIAGPLMRAPRISGSVEIASLEINLPDSLPFSATPIEVTHRNAPRQVRARVARKARARGKAHGSPISVAMDVTIAASSRIIVRGHGVNAELGGRLAVRGTSDKPQVTGGFEARRGTLDIIGKRLTLKRGRLVFPGSLDPELDFIAEAPASDVTAQVLLKGHPSDPKIEFTSTPELPRDEVLSRLLFGKPSGKLTAGQTIQLAQALAQLTGAGGKGLDDLRKSLGVDALDVGADDSGKNVGVGVGRRINDNIYVGVRQGATASSSNVTVDIDVYKGLKVEGQAGKDGQTSVGVGYEYEY